MLLAVKDLDVNNLAALAMGQPQARILHLAGLLTKDRAEQLLLGTQFLLTLGRDLAHQDVQRPHLRPDSNDPTLIQILQRFITHVGDVTGDLLWTKLGIASLYLVLLNVDGSKLVLAHQALADEDRILKVSTFPRHEGTQHIMPQRQLPTFRRGTVRQHLVLFHSLPFVDNRPLINTGALVRALILVKSVRAHSIGFTHQGLITSDADDLPLLFCQNNLPRIEGSPPFHPSGHQRRLGLNQRHRLTLHVGAHQCTVGIVVLQERNEGRRNTHDLTRRDIDVVNSAWHSPQELVRAACRDSRPHKVPLLIQFRIGLRNRVAIFLVG